MKIYVDCSTKDLLKGKEYIFTEDIIAWTNEQISAFEPLKAQLVVAPCPPEVAELHYVHNWLKRLNIECILFANKIDKRGKVYKDFKEFMFFPPAEKSEIKWQLLNSGKLRDFILSAKDTMNPIALLITIFKHANHQQQVKILSILKKAYTKEIPEHLIIPMLFV